MSLTDILVGVASADMAMPAATKPQMTIACLHDRGILDRFDAAGFDIMMNSPFAATLRRRRVMGSVTPVTHIAALRRCDCCHLNDGGRRTPIP
jgi:hypothetical protein